MSDMYSFTSTRVKSEFIIGDYIMSTVTIGEKARVRYVYNNGDVATDELDTHYCNIVVPRGKIVKCNSPIVIRRVF